MVRFAIVTPLKVLVSCRCRIIVGVKYCFRYNQRNRALRAQADGEHIDLSNMPRPHRRRREKKLMTLDEVNQKFPRMRYKQWRASREQDGLPTEGGISAAPSRAVSRAASIKDVDAITNRQSHETGRPGSSLSNVVHPSTRPLSSSSRAEHETPTPDATHDAIFSEPARSPTTAIPPIQEEPVTSEKTTERVGSPLPAPFKESDPSAEDDEDSDGDPIHNAIADQGDLSPGDTCAICLDTL
jgi:hypothetical protein